MTESWRAALDDVDELLIEELVSNGRATLSALAEKVRLSVSAVQSRVRRLESRGVIQGYTARVDPSVRGNDLVAFVAITPLDPAYNDDVLSRLRHIPSIASCHSVAGDDSYVLSIRGVSPIELESLLHQIRTAANVRTRTTMILRSVFDR